MIKGLACIRRIVEVDQRSPLSVNTFGTGFAFGKTLIDKFKKVRVESEPPGGIRFGIGDRKCFATIWLQFDVVKNWRFAAQMNNKSVDGLNTHGGRLVNRAQKYNCSFHSGNRE